MGTLSFRPCCVYHLFRIYITRLSCTLHFAKRLNDALHELIHTNTLNTFTFGRIFAFSLFTLALNLLFLVRIRVCTFFPSFSLWKYEQNSYHTQQCTLVRIVNALFFIVDIVYNWNHFHLHWIFFVELRRQRRRKCCALFLVINTIIMRISVVDGSALKIYIVQMVFGRMWKCLRIVQW